MPTVKLVVIGASGVGKTSLRTQYISGRFSTGYRATIGADFIAKTLPHPTKQDQVVTLQIWDTAGQERFSSLSTAFFRGADAALLMFDVNQPETLVALKKWWQVFRERAPLYDEDLDDYCCVVVGNKTDLVDGTSTPVVSEAQALRFLDDLVPPSSDIPITIEPVVAEEPADADDSALDLSSSFPPSRSRSIDIHHYARKSKHAPYDNTNGTLSSTYTGLSSYHTPSSSLFDVYASARSSPSRLTSPVRSRRTSSFSSSSSSARTITPSMFRRLDPPAPPTPPPDRGPTLFFTSAKTGEGVHDVFEYIARRVVQRWEDEEVMDARTFVQAPLDTNTIRLGPTSDSTRSRCC